MEDNTNTDTSNTIYNTVYNNKEYKQHKNTKTEGSLITPFFYIYNPTLHI